MMTVKYNKTSSYSHTGEIMHTKKQNTATINFSDAISKMKINQNQIEFIKA